MGMRRKKWGQCPKEKSIHSAWITVDKKCPERR